MSEKKAISISGDQLTLSARIVNGKNNRGIQGLLVEVFDKDQIGKDDYLGSSITRDDGSFEIRCSASDYASLFLDKKPDIYFRVSRQHKLLLNTKQEPIRNADENTPPILLSINIPEESLPDGELDREKISWEKIPDVAQYKGADWKNEVRRALSIGLEEAKQIAEADPAITYFIHLKAPMLLEGKAGPDGWTAKGSFQPGDAVFFSGKPTYGSATQANAYEKRKVSWVKKENAAQYKGADWRNEIFRKSNLSLSQALDIVERNPQIAYFFICHDTMWLEGKAGRDGWTEKGHFHDGDAVFFSGKPWYGNAPQAVAFEKTAVPFWV